MHRRRAFAGVAAALVMAALVGEARVFQRLDGRGATLFRADVVGRLIYETVMQINGSDAAVTVTACDRSAATLRASLEACGSAVFYKAVDGIGAGRIEGGGRTASILALTPGRSDRSLVVSVERSDADREQSRDAAKADGATGIPGLPGSVLTFTLRNADTRTALETRRAAVAPSAAIAYYDAFLRQDGWTSPLPRAKGDGGMTLYIKESDVCCVHVGSADAHGECWVTVVRKPGAAR